MLQYWSRLQDSSDRGDWGFWLMCIKLSGYATVLFPSFKTCRITRKAAILLRSRSHEPCQLPKSVGIKIWGRCTPVQNFMAIHLTAGWTKVVDRPTTLHCHPHTASMAETYQHVQTSKFNNYNRAATSWKYIMMCSFWYNY